MLSIDPISADDFDVASVLQAIAAGTPKAETALVRRYSRGLLLMLTQRCGDIDLAGDLHQDAFMVVLARLRKQPLDNPEQVKAFIHTTAVNLFINHYRKEKRRNTFSDEDSVGQAVDPSPNQLKRLQQEDTATLVRGLIAELPKHRDRHILWRYFIDDIEKSEICMELDLPSEHFDRVLYRAKQRIRQKMDLQVRDSGSW